MIRIGGRVSNTDARIDSANKALHDIRDEVLETDKWVDEIEQTVAALRADMEVSRQELKDELTFDKRKLLDLSYRVNQCDSLIQDLQSKPVPLIPDISPLRAEVRLLRVVLDELMISHNEELTAVWKSLGELNRRIDEIKPTDLKPVYTWLKTLMFFNVSFAVYLIIEALYVR